LHIHNLPPPLTYLAKQARVSAVPALSVAFSDYSARDLAKRQIIKKEYADLTSKLAHRHIPFLYLAK